MSPKTKATPARTEDKLREMLSVLKDAEQMNDEGETPNAWTCRELQEIWGANEERTRNYIRSLMALGKARHVMVWRVQMMNGVRRRIDGYQIDLE